MDEISASLQQSNDSLEKLRQAEKTLLADIATLQKEKEVDHKNRASLQVELGT